MTALTYALALSGVVLIATGAVVLIHLARDYAEDRGREEQYAREWAAIHKRNQRRDRAS